MPSAASLGLLLAGPGVLPSPQLLYVHSLSEHNWVHILTFFCFVLFLFFFNFYLFIYGCVGSSFLCKGFLQLRQVGATLHRGARASHHRGLLLRSTGSRRTGSAIMAHRPSCSAACGIFPDQGSNPCPLHWQADSQPLRHQGSPHPDLFNLKVGPDRWLLCTRAF